MSDRPSSPASAALWHRWLLAYLFLYMAPFPLDHVPGLDALVSIAGAPWQALVTWVGDAVFGVEAVRRYTGSGDTMYDYVQIACLAVLAIPAALAWPRRARSGVTWDVILDRTRAFARLYLGCFLMIYGLSKAIPAQFPAPGPDRLIVPYGDSSPMGLLWTFMGASAAYEVLTGLVELIAGLLLFWRRTATLGALLAVMALGQVVALNFCHDVAVKQFSSHLLVLALFVLAPDVRRLLDVLWFHRASAPRPLDPHPIRRPGLRRAVAVARVGVIAVIGVFTFANSLAFLGAARGEVDGPTLHGVYRVASFARGGEAGPALADEARWVRVGINQFGVGAIQRADGTGERLRLRVDEDKKTLTWSRSGTDELFEFTFSRPNPDELLLEGEFEGAKTVVLLRATDTPFLLTSRGFRWVQERPFNK